MGRSGEHRKHRLKRHFTNIAVISGVAVAVLAAGAWALAATGRDPGSTRAALDTAPQADPPRTVPSHASRGGTRSPEPSPSPTSPAPSASPQASTSPEAPESSDVEVTLKAEARAKKKPTYRVLRSGSCQASYYWQGQTTASGERFDPDELTAAHRSLPMGSKVRVTNRNNGRSVIVRINDRGPFVGGRCLDLSKAAMSKVGGTGSGVIPVRYQVLVGD